MDVFDFRGRGQSNVDPVTEDLAYAVIGAAIEVHRLLGTGLPEHTYRDALSHELTLRGIPHQVEAPVKIYYKGKLVGEGSVDVLVGERLVVELKVVESFHPAHRAQVIADLQATKLPLGLLINFNCATLKDGVKRVIRTG